MLYSSIISVLKRYPIILKKNISTVLHILFIVKYDITKVDTSNFSCVNEYLKFTKKYFDQSFLDDNKKTNLFISGLKNGNVDICYLQ